VMVLAGSLSCAAHRRAAPGDLLAGSESSPPEPVRIAGYTSTNGRAHSFKGYVTVTPDSLVFARLPMKGIVPHGSPERVFALPRDQVSSVRVVTGVSVGRSLLFGVSLLGFFALTWAFMNFPVME